MKTLSLLSTITLIISISACSKDTDTDVVRPGDELNIEREEEYKGKDVRESNKLPRKSEELDLKRD